MNKVTVPQLAGHLFQHEIFEEHCLSLDLSKRDRLNVTYAKNFIARNPDIEANFVIEFFHKIQETGANPYFGDIYCIPYKDWKTGRMLATVMFGYQFLLDKAKATGEWEGYEGPYFKEHVENWCPATGLIRDTAICTVMVYRKGIKAVQYTADYWEFVKTNKEDIPSSTWKNWKMMLEKCALANAIRRAFPDVLRGIYCREEMIGSEHETQNMPEIQMSSIPAPVEIPVQVQALQPQAAREVYYEPITQNTTQPPKPMQVYDIDTNKQAPAPENNVVAPEPVEKKKAPPKRQVQNAPDRPATNDEMQKIMIEMNKAVFDKHLDYVCLGALQRVQRSYNTLYRLALYLANKEYDEIRNMLLL